MLGVNFTHQLGTQRKLQKKDRHGVILILASLLVVVILMIVAFSVDLGVIASANTDMKRATDSAALAGAGSLFDGANAANLRAFEYLVRNPVGNYNLAAGDAHWEANLGTLLTAHANNFETQFGHWDAETRTFAVSRNLPSTIRVIASRPNLPLFFSGIFGYNEFSVTAESIARYQPRDIALVLDFSASMNDDSELKRIDENGNNRTAVENSLAEIYTDLSPMSHGNLQFPPQHVTLVGDPPADKTLPQISVTFRCDDVFVSSSKDLSNIVMQFADGTTEKIEDLTSPTGAFHGTCGNDGKYITKVWVKSGINDSGDGPGYGEAFEDGNAAIITALGLTDVEYPYPSGSWDDYISYVKTSANVHRSGYRRSYGYMTLINYWLEEKPTHTQTPDLWKGNAQPIGAVKDAVGVFMDYIQQIDTDDRVALILYNSSSQEAFVEHSLTDDFDTIETTIAQRQAGHYDRYTNIGDGIRYARQELVNNGRRGAFKMIVLMTDGMANRPYGVDARQYALGQADLTKQVEFPIATISLGGGADTALMQSIADRTDGHHFNIPGSSTVTDYKDDLTDVFSRIAKERPLVLVK